MTTDGAKGGARADRWIAVFAAGVPLLLTAAVYLRSLRNGFVYDDRGMVIANRFLPNWSFIWISFTHDVWWFSDPQRLPQSFYYRPLENTWLALNYHLFGVNPLGWHASMIAVQLVGVWLVYLLARKLAQNRVAAAIAAALFGLMPIHAGAISWGRSIPVPMSAEFQMGAVVCFMRRARAPRRNLAAALALYAGALLSHESAAVFPAIVALYVFLFEGADDPVHSSVGARISSSALAAAPFAALIVPYAAVRFLILGFHLPISERNTWSALQRVLAIPGGLGQYALLLAFPWRAGPAHELHVPSSPLSPALWFPTLALAGAGAGTWLLLRRHPHRRLYLFCAAWILIALAPYLNFASLNSVEAIEDRYLFFASAPWCIALGDLTAGFMAAGDTRAWIASAATAAVALAYGGWLWHIEPYWHDNLTYFSKCIEMYPTSWLCHGDLGLELAKRGDLKGAEREIEVSIPLRPPDGIGYFNLASVHIRMDKPELAKQDLVNALKLMRRPIPQIYIELALAADQVGDQDTSERAVERLASMPHGELVAAEVRARIKMRHRDFAGAAAVLRAIKPAQRDRITAWLLLAEADSRQGREDLALEDYDAAVRLAPDRANVHAMRARALYSLGLRDEALSESKRALALDPNDALAQKLSEQLGAAPPE
jgi:protein O-mannosyl-transferase